MDLVFRNLSPKLFMLMESIDHNQPQIWLPSSREILLQSRSQARVLKPEKAHCSESFSARTVYEVIFPRVVKYSKEFQTVQFLDINSDGMGATATIALGSVCDRPSFVIDPVSLDTLLPVVGFISNLRGDLHEAYICDEIGLVEFIPSFIKSGSIFVIHCNISISEKNAMLGEFYAVWDCSSSHDGNPFPTSSSWFSQVGSCKLSGDKLFCPRTYFSSIESKYPGKIPAKTHDC